jgi:LacI family transcriptional regulator
MRAEGKTPRVFLIPLDWQMPGQPGIDQRVDSARLLLSHENRPTAVVAYEQAEAMAVVQAAHLLGLQIPRDLSLVQFHHGIDFRFFIPIQTVSNVMQEVGKQAVEMLLEKISNPQSSLPAQAVPMEMLEGVTCQPHRT